MAEFRREEELLFRRKYERRIAIQIIWTPNRETRTIMLYTKTHEKAGYWLSMNFDQWDSLKTPARFQAFPHNGLRDEYHE